ncbi:double-strand break repair helicase AddA [Yoonia sp. 208BN28-4]|uniref:double-strand break repair helicase AddA n=1 Tax=Yoonia sp. 208BN28-4 TaxID=3126505 RepID=UPI00309C8717
MIRDNASQAQVDAADPLNSTWLSANAGSGKTRVLTDRVARLLLEKVDPQNILCLTYTKAAAAEMQNRLFKRLGDWAMMPDAKLRQDLQGLGFVRAITAEEIAAARTLFASAIETPGGLKIQTIHSFCAGVLRRFPLEAGVSPNFREMEDRQAEILRSDVVDAMVEGPDSAVVHDLLRHFTGDDLSKLTAAIAGKRDAFAAMPSAKDLRDIFALTPGLTLDILRDAVFDGGGLAAIQHLAKVCAAGSKTEMTAAAKLAKVTGTTADLAVLEGVFLTGSGAKIPYGAKIGTFPTKATREAHPELIDDINVIMETVEQARPDRLSLMALDRTQALYDFATRFVPAYEAKKLAHGALDFDDLIRKTRALLTDRALAQWVLFRLDGGIDHVLVDEAQDTSPTQWAVIEQLTQEFTAGEGADPDRARTIFVVGDKKQSIYSFQGADPDAFDQMKHHFADGLMQSGQALQDMSLDYSFRSSQAILQVVDNTFVHNRAEGMEKPVSHIAFKGNMPGRVDLWPVIEDDSEKPEIDWTAPVDHLSDDHVAVQMANRVASEIKRMIREETIPVEIGNSGEYQRRAVTEGDILILVQRRSDLFQEIIRACKAADLKIAGADRLRVGAELAVKDLAAVLSFLALPEDDLSLASALKSPLFGWSEQDVYHVAHHRPDRAFLWQSLRTTTDHPQTLAVLNDLLDQADFLRPYDLIERILTRHDGRQKFIARLGAEAEDGIDALLSQALAYESTGVPSLTGFLSWMETDDVEVKRQMDSQGDRIRVMTVHGAKGLEAPIVFLPDTAHRDNQAKAELFPAGDHVVWKVNKTESPPALDVLRDDIIAAQARERMRLLYVAMTRAEKWLIVGAAGKIGDGDTSWYNIVADGMTTSGDVTVQSGGMDIRRVTHGDWDGSTQITVTPAVPLKITPPVFAPVISVPPTSTVSPSGFQGEKVIAGEHASMSEDDAMRRGTKIHLLLEHLPHIPPADRLDAGAKLLASLDEPGDEPLVDAVIALLDAPDLAHVFDPNALTEVGISAELPDGRRMHGTIDRLIVTDDRVTAIDYKTNRIVPDDADQTPEGLLRQMGAYAHALAQVYPDHTIDTAILWTETATLMHLPSELVSSALARVIADDPHLDQ